MAAGLRSLNWRHQMFIERYLTHFDQYKAYEEAGWKSDNIDSMKMRAARILRDPLVRKAITLRFDVHRMTAEETLVRLAEQARGEGAAYLDERGRLDFEKLKKDGKLHLVESVKQTKYGLEVKFYNAQRALELMGKVHSLFGDKTDVQRDVTVHVVYGEGGQPRGGDEEIIDVPLQLPMLPDEQPIEEEEDWVNEP